MNFSPILTIHCMTQRRDCAKCGPCELEVEGPIETRAETMSEDIALACDDEAEIRGWKMGHCPACAWEYRHELRDQYRAETPVED